MGLLGEYRTCLSCMLCGEAATSSVVEDSSISIRPCHELDDPCGAPTHVKAVICGIAAPYLANVVDAFDVCLRFVRFEVAVRILQRLPAGGFARADSSRSCGDRGTTEGDSEEGEHGRQAGDPLGHRDSFSGSAFSPLTGYCKLKGGTSSL